MIKNTKEFYQDFMNLHLSGGLKRGFDTGWKSLDPYYSIKCGDLNVVTGIPNSGKSEWMDALMINLATHHNFRWMVFSPENYPISSHIAKLSEKYTGQPFTVGRTKQMDMETADAAAHWMYKHFDFYDYGDDGVSPDELVHRASEWASAIPEEENLGMVVDPWNEMDIARGNNSEPEYINATLSKFRRMARKYKIALYIIAHPTKLTKNPDGSYSCPTPYDIAGSAHFRNKADVCIAVHREHSVADGGNTQIHIQKVRGKHIGKVGMIELRWDRVTGRYSELLGEYENVRG